MLPLFYWSHVYFPFVSDKWILLHVFAFAVISSALWRSKNFAIPRLYKSELIVLSLLVSLVLYQQLQHYNDQAIVEKATFIGLVLVFYQSLIQYRHQTLHFMAVVAIPVSLLVLSFSWWGWPKADDSSLFGNVNMLAQYLGAAILIVLLGTQTWPPKKRMWIWGFVAICVFSIFILRCRSILLSLLFAAVVMILAQSSNRAKRLVLVMLVAGVLGLWMGNPSWLPQSLMSGKVNGSGRVQLWQQSVELLKQNPFGIGEGRFQFAFLPVAKAAGLRLDESLVYNSPHNEFLRWAIEYSPLYLVLLIGLAFSLIWRAEYTKSQSYLALSQMIAIGSFVAVESTLQFPWQNPYFNFFGAFYWGLVLAQRQSVFLTRKWVVAVGLVLWLLFIAAWCGAEAFSRQSTQSVQKLESFCTVSPSHWQTCLKAARKNIELNEFDRAKKILSKELDRHPNNFLAHRFMSFIYFHQNQAEEGCRHLYEYTSLFNKGELYQVTCEKIKSPTEK